MGLGVDSSPLASQICVLEASSSRLTRAMALHGLATLQTVLWNAIPSLFKEDSAELSGPPSHDMSIPTKGTTTENHRVLPGPQMHCPSWTPGTRARQGLARAALESQPELHLPSSVGQEVAQRDVLTPARAGAPTSWPSRIGSYLDAGATSILIDKTWQQ